MRPASIVLACILLCLAAAVTMGVTLLGGSLPHEARAQMGSPFVLFLAAGFALVCAAGFWGMKRWAVVAYSAAAVLQILVIGLSFTTELPVAIAVLGWMNWSELS